VTLLQCRAPSRPALALAIIILVLLVKARLLLHLWYQRLVLALEHSGPLAVPWFVKVNRPPRAWQPLGTFSR